MPTPAALEALHILRDGSQFRWYVVPLFVFVLYVYANEAAERRWNAFFAGLGFWAMDWFNEIWNGLVMHFTGHAPIWGAPKHTAFLILIGLNVEICFMFAIAGIGFVRMLPADPKWKILGLPNRPVLAAAWSAFCVGVEYALNSIGELTWDWPFWNRGAPWLIFLVGYLPFFVVAYTIYDMKRLRTQAITAGGILAFDAVCLALFGPGLGWI